MKPIAIVFGANSAIAQALLPHFSEQYQVLAVSRSEPHSLPEGVTHYLNDYSDADLAQLADKVKREWGDIDLLFSALGVLHNDHLRPEKRLADLNAEQLTQYFAINTIVPALILKHFVPLMPRSRETKAVLLSAKVAGISDNRLGGWYGYRASKAALNMLIKTASVELARSHRRLCLVALHPGTTQTSLSEPFTSNLSSDKLFSPEQTATRLWSVVRNLSPEDNGRFLHWDGTDLPW